MMYVREALTDLPEEPPHTVPVFVQTLVYTVTQRALLTELHLDVQEL